VNEVANTVACMHRCLIIIIRAAHAATRAGYRYSNNAIRFAGKAEDESSDGGSATYDKVLLQFRC
jgi:hypothetical protein